MGAFTQRKIIEAVHPFSKYSTLDDISQHIFYPSYPHYDLRNENQMRYFSVNNLPIAYYTATWNHPILLTDIRVHVKENNSFADFYLSYQLDIDREMILYEENGITNVRFYFVLILMISFTSIKMFVNLWNHSQLRIHIPAKHLR